tara:strand:+ start:442 stop:684 length:243 start_codon:yes stop_codon:yes gene_type:complete
MTRFIRALEAKYQAKVEEALATIDLYMSKSVGIGEHPDITEVLDNYISMLDDNQSKLETLRSLFASPQEESEASPKTSEK